MYEAQNDMSFTKITKNKSGPKKGQVEKGGSGEGPESDVFTFLISPFRPGPQKVYPVGARVQKIHPI